jgi:hypothetical protein
MQRLGEILIEKGVLSLTELHTALETCRMTGGRLGTQLLEFGYVDESVLLDALSKQMSVSNVTKVKLLHSPLDVRRLVPPHVGRRIQAVPFEKTSRGIKVAMTNPNDRAAIDEISTHIRTTIVPYVATEKAVLAALDGAEIDDADWSLEVAPQPVKARRSGDVEEWNRLWEPPRFRPGSLFQTSEPSAFGKTVLMASFPDLSPLTSGKSAPFEPVVDDSNFSDSMHRAGNRDEIGSILARFAASKYDRVCLFSVHRQIVTGWMARGRSVVIEDLQSFSVSLKKDSIFSDIGPADSYVGAIEENQPNGELIQALADPAPIEVVLVPVRVKQRLVAFVLADDPGHTASQDHVDALVTASRKAGVAFEALILRKKILS